MAHAHSIDRFGKARIVGLLAPPLEGEDHTKDTDFSRKGIRACWAAGYGNAGRALADASWEADVDPIEGFYLHECRSATAPLG
jgi:NTE family protein